MGRSGSIFFSDQNPHTMPLHGLKSILVRQIISKEDRAKPYSDQKIASLLKDQNIGIARRTVAKYRESMGILPSPKRKQLI